MNDMKVKDNNNFFFTHLGLLMSSLMVFLLMTSCGEEKVGERVEEVEKAIEAAVTSLSGSTTKGPIANARIDVKVLNPDGSVGSIVGSGIANARGEFDIPLPNFAGGAVVLEVSVGQYRDEATGALVDLATQGIKLSLVTQPASGQKTASLSITPFTTMAAEMAKEEAKRGKDLAVAIADSHAKIAKHFGVANIDKSRPADLTDDVADAIGAPETVYGLMLVALSQSAKDFSTQHGVSVTALEMTEALSRDIKDGSFDGRESGVNVEVLNTTLALVPDQATVGLATALDAFILSPKNQSGISPNDVLALKNHLTQLATAPTPQDPTLSTPAPLIQSVEFTPSSITAKVGERIRIDVTTSPEATRHIISGPSSPFISFIDSDGQVLTNNFFVVAILPPGGRSSHTLIIGPVVPPGQYNYSLIVLKENQSTGKVEGREIKNFIISVEPSAERTGLIKSVIFTPQSTEAGGMIRMDVTVSPEVVGYNVGHKFIFRDRESLSLNGPFIRQSAPISFSIPISGPNASTFIDEFFTNSLGGTTPAGEHPFILAVFDQQGNIEKREFNISIKPPPPPPPPPDLSIKVLVGAGNANVAQKIEIFGFSQFTTSQTITTDGGQADFLFPSTACSLFGSVCTFGIVISRPFDGTRAPSSITKVEAFLPNASPLSTNVTSVPESGFPIPNIDTYRIDITLPPDVSDSLRAFRGF